MITTLVKNSHSQLLFANFAHNSFSQLLFTAAITKKMTAFSGRRPLVKDDLQWKTTFGGLGWTMPHLDVLIETKNTESQKIL